MCPQNSFLNGVVATGTCAHTRADPISLGTMLKIRWRHPERVCEERREEKMEGEQKQQIHRGAGLLAKSGCGTQPRSGWWFPPSPQPTWLAMLPPAPALSCRRAGA